MKNFTISKATNIDVTALNTLVNAAYRGETSKQGWTTEADLLDGIRTDEEAIKETLTKENVWILKVLNEENEIVACVQLEKHLNKLYLGMLTVLPKLQGSGIGKKLLAKAEDFALEKKCNCIYMTVITDRLELIAWYERHGFVLTNEKKPFPSGNPRFGLPKKHLEFAVLEKQLNTY